jgi:hypothetical protein
MFKHRLRLILAPILSIGLFAPAWQAHGTTRSVATCSYADVNSAVAASITGDTVNVPGGSCTWSSNLLIDKGINVIGAGKGVTVITNAVGTVVTISKTQSNPVRLSGFTFNNVDGQTPIVAIVGPSFKVRIDHIVVNKGDTAIGSNFLGFPGTGPVYGVVDNSDFYNTVRTYFATDIRVGDASWGTTAWTEFIGQESTFPGTDKMLYFENNQFIWNTSNTATNTQGALYGQYGGKAAFRYNTFNGLCTYIDAHGDTPDTGTIFYEIYNNTFVENDQLCSQGDIVWLRGGQMIAHDNTFTGGAIPFRMSVYWTTDLAAHRVRNTYYWGNTWNGNSTQSSLVTVNDSGQTPASYSSANIKLNQQYFLAAPQSGQTYYPYTPYIYPHPLRTERAPPNMRAPVVAP